MHNKVSTIVIIILFVRHDVILLINIVNHIDIVLNVEKYCC